MMKVIADLHIHSRYSRATSDRMNIKDLSYFAGRKGLNLLGTGDFSHPIWNKELKQALGKDNEGIFTLNNMNYILSNEISLIYSQGNKLRKVHLVILAPDFGVVDQINEWLLTKGRIDYDGRPIFGMTCPEFTERIMEISRDNFIIPAHVWTPWFGLFGSKSGFDSVEECFQDQEKHIHALETGLSSDPQMNWRLSSLDKYALVSNSDSHSPWPSRIGRECNIFELKEITYKNIISAIKNKDSEKFICTIEVDPSYGKYHFDGHRDCNISLEPKEAVRIGNICPVCKKPLTIGVLHRVEELADRPDGFVPKGAIPFRKLLPLAEIVSGKYGMGIMTKTVMEKENEFIEKFGTELNVLLDAEKSELEKIDANISEAIIRNREGAIEISAGYDGVYGKPVFDKKKNSEIKNALSRTSQKSLSEF